MFSYVKQTKKNKTVNKKKGKRYEEVFNRNRHGARAQHDY